MDVVFLIGRILFGALFLASSYGHLSDKGQMAAYAEGRGVRPGRPAVLVSGLMILVGGLLILLGIWIDLGAILVALFTLSSAVLMHGFWRDSGEARLMEMVQFQKDLALCGGALILLYLAWAQGGELGLTITDPLLF